MSRLALAVVGIGLLASAVVGQPMRDERALMDSLRYLPPNMRFYYLQEDNRPQAPAGDGTFGLRLLGKWGAGPSVKVTGRDSLVFLSRGSEVVVVNFADTANPRVLSYIQVNGLVSRSVLVGNRLYVGSTGSDPKYIEVFDVSSPASPVKLGEVQTRLSDLDVVDTLAYVIARDSFRVFNFADPGNPRQVGACRDSGYDISVCNGYAYVGDRWGLYVVDATNPASPHQVASWGNDVISVRARNTICCVTTGNPNQPDELNFTILDVRVPSAPYRIGYLANAGAYDIFLAETLAFLSGYYTGGHVFRILDISDSTQPTLIGSSPTPGGHMGVWANPPARRAYVADDLKGLTAMVIVNPASPAVDTNFLEAGVAEDICVDGDRAYVAGQSFGVTILDVSAPDRPTELGHIDSTRGMISNAVAARDSFAYMGWVTHPWLRSVDVADPMNPVKAGAVDLFNPAEDMVLRDSFLYVAEDNRFQVVNVARPRSPVLVGSCNLPDYAAGMWLKESLAYVAYWPVSIVSITNPVSPVIVGQIWRGCSNVVVRDTIAFLSSGVLVWYSVANPGAPYVVDSINLARTVRGLAVVDNVVYACNLLGVLFAVDVSDLHSPRIVATTLLPYVAERITYSPPYLYAVCLDAGISIYETTSVGIRERTAQDRPPEGTIVVQPNPTTGHCVLSVVNAGSVNVSIRDVAGRTVPVERGQPEREAGLALELNGLEVGVYFVVVNVAGRVVSTKLIIQ